MTTSFCFHSCSIFQCSVYAELNVTIYRNKELIKKNHNLKNESSQNTLDEKDVNNLWIPNIVYQNNKDNDNTKTALDRSDLKILRQGEFARSGLNVADEIEVFEGSENPIQLAQSLTKEFKCSYELVFFPFDTQVNLLKVELVGSNRRVLCYAAQIHIGTQFFFSFSLRTQLICYPYH